MGKFKKIGIFGHYGNNNLGDEAIIQSVIQNIRMRIPEAVVVGFSINPQDTSARYGIDSYPIRKTHSASVGAVPKGSSDVSERLRFDVPQKNSASKIKSNIKKIPLLAIVAKTIFRLGSVLRELTAEISFLCVSYGRLKNIDILLIAGSNQFLDNFGGVWGFPYTLLKWSIIAKASGCRVYYASIGAGPISQKMSKTLIRCALRFSDYVSLRDESSRVLIREVGYVGRSHVYPDLAHSLNVEQVSASPLPFERQCSALPVIGINPMPLYDSRYWCEKDDSKYAMYLGKMVEFTEKLLDRGYPFFFFATMKKDNNVIDDILNLLNNNFKDEINFNQYVLPSKTVNDLMSNIFAADIVIATRFHGTVLSLLANKPTLGVCYYRKAKELLFEMGQGEYAVDLDTFTVDNLWARFEKLIENRAIEKNKIKIKNLEYLGMLNKQYDNLFKNDVC